MNKLFSTVKLLSGARYLPRRTQRDFIIRNTKGKAFRVVADIGAGKAPYKKHLKFDKYIAIDRESREEGSSIQINDLMDGIPLEAESVDLVICTEVLEHVPRPQFLCNEIYRILRPGGVALLTTPMVWPLHEEPYDFFRYTKYGVKYLLAQSRFSSVEIRPSNGYWYSVLSLLLFHNKHWYLYPINLFVNLIGYFVFKFEKNDIFPLGWQVAARK